MRKAIAFYFLSFLVYGLRSQSISPEVISSTGGFYSNATGMISFTEGEPLGEMISSSGNMITQGFEQRDILVASIRDIESAVSNFFLCPNPSNGTFKVLSPENPISEIIIYNSLGEKIFSNKYNDQTEVLVCLEARQGIYFLLYQHEGKKITKRIVVQ